jgi:hypothetical protein
MKSVPIENCTRRLGAPQEWDHSQAGICHTLEIVDTPDGFMVSAWRPSERELELLNQGRPILLGIKGRSHPVVFLSMGDNADGG